MNKKEQNSNFKSRIRTNKLMAVVFFLTILFIFVINIITKDKQYSESENRMLQQKPTITLSGIESGRFMEQYEQYKSDQFWGRNLWVKIKTSVDLLEGKRDSNNVFKGKNNYLLEDIAKPDTKVLSQNLDAIKSFQSKYSDIPMHMMLVPNAANILSDKLPTFAVTADQNEFLESIKASLNGYLNWIEVSPVLQEHKDENIYYHTDHHWTTLGAYYCFQQLAKDFNLDLSTASNLEAYAVTDSFNGTLSSTSGYETSYKEPIYIYSAKNKEDNTNVIVHYVDEQTKTSTLYDKSKLDTKDKYAVFLGGNHSRIDIKTTSESTDKLLLIKDSYANCMIPFLTSYFREIIVIDPRYYYGDLNSVMEQNSISTVLFLYNCNTFLEDNSINGVLQNSEIE